MTDPIGVDSLPPTQYLMLEVLAARHRLGEALWTFPSGPAYRTAADQLAQLGIVGWKSGVAPKTIQVWFTDAGRKMLPADYKPSVPQPTPPPSLDLRVLAVILNAGYNAANDMQDPGVAQALWCMTEQAVALHRGPASPIGNLDEEFTELAARYE